MDSKLGIHVMTLANSIIGVSILAMPYCFKQCGIILSIVLLILSSIISRLACHFLLKSAIKARLRTFEFLAYHVFGSFGKLFVEIGMIGFLIGTCIAFFVVMGDLGPQIVAHLSETLSSDELRTYILIALAVFCVLPLGLLRNVDSLSGVCTATIGFYACLVLKIMGESAPHILLSDWSDKVNYWRPAGILQCIPIFSMALFCQTQLFEIYQAIPNASLEKMNELVRVAVNICTCVYIFVGIFGYIAISHELNFTGNILMNFKPSTMTEVMKIGFVLSVAFSFPLVIFPCRASLYSLIYKPTYTALHEASSIYIPEGKFKILTFLIVAISLTIGIYIPNIELVLGLVGSTIGVMICVLFPAACFICLTSKNTNERILAQIMLFIGIVVMVLGTYANLYAIEEVTHNPMTEKPIQLTKNVVMHEDVLLTTLKNIVIKDSVKENDLNKNVIDVEQMKEIRHEPPQPEAPLEEPSDNNIAKEKPPQVEPLAKANSEIEDNVKKLVKDDVKNSELKDNVVKVEVRAVLPLVKDKVKSPDVLPVEINLEANTPKAENNIENPNDSPKNIANDLPKIEKESITKKAEEVDIEAIKKEDKELQDNQDVKDDGQRKLYEQQQKLMEENKKLLEQLKARQEEESKKMKVLKNIESLAKLAMESIGADNGLKAEEKMLNETKPATNSSVNLAQKERALKNLAPLPIALAEHSKRQIEAKSAEIENNKLKTVQEELVLQVNKNKLTENDPNTVIEADKNKLAKTDSNEPVQLDAGKLAKPETDKNNLAEVVDKSKTKTGKSSAEVNIVQLMKESSVNDLITETKQEPENNKQSKNLAEEPIVKNEETKVEPQPEPPKTVNEKVDNMHRDILSKDNYLRRKRETEAEHCEKNLTEPATIIDVGEIKVSRDLKNIETDKV